MLLIVGLFVGVRFCLVCVLDLLVSCVVLRGVACLVSACCCD